MIGLGSKKNTLFINFHLLTLQITAILFYKNFQLHQVSIELVNNYDQELT